jgi:hypothetical protein
VFLYAAPYFLGDLESPFFGEFGQDGLIFVAAETGGLAAAFFVQLADEAPDLSDDSLAEQVAVGVVYLEVVDDRPRGRSKDAPRRIPGGARTPSRSGS